MKFFTKKSFNKGNNGYGCCGLFGFSLGKKPNEYFVHFLPKRTCWLFGYEEDEWSKTFGGGPLFLIAW